MPNPQYREDSKYKSKSSNNTKKPQSQIINTMVNVDNIIKTS